MAAGKNMYVGKERIIFISSIIVEVLDRNLNTVAASFLANMRLNISAPFILW
jgi:hypothetical protein